MSEKSKNIQAFETASKVLTIGGLGVLAVGMTKAGFDAGSFEFMDVMRQNGIGGTMIDVGATGALVGFLMSPFRS